MKTKICCPNCEARMLFLSGEFACPNCDLTAVPHPWQNTLNLWYFCYYCPRQLVYLKRYPQIDFHVCTNCYTIYFRKR